MASTKRNTVFFANKDLRKLILFAKRTEFPCYKGFVWRNIFLPTRQRPSFYQHDICHMTSLYLHAIFLPKRQPPKNGVIALWPNTRVVKCEHYDSQKQIGFNNKINWYRILLTFIFKFTASRLWTKIYVLSNLSNCGFTTGQY